MCCGMTNYTSSVAANQESASIAVTKEELATVVEASKDKSKKVKLRYYGGGVSLKTKPACPSCGGGGQYAMTTAETIQFVSEDAPNGVFKLFVQAGREYYVTEKQADYMLTLTFRNRAGEVVHKFKKVEG